MENTVSAAIFLTGTSKIVSYVNLINRISGRVHHMSVYTQPDTVYIHTAVHTTALEGTLPDT